jgi:formylglycine-generating enzyme required for sulfatase activity
LLKYRAFISYSHADTDWARWLHRGLESFHIDKDLVGRETATGTIPQALRPIFRDRDDFTAGALTEQTQAALDASAALIVICSPSSAKSLYVNEEIKLFKSRHPDRPLIPLIVGGSPGDSEQECFPSALKFKLDAKGRITKKRVELLAADAREEGDGKDLSLAKVIAGLLGLSSDDVFRRAERERRAATRRKRRVQGLVGALALLLAVAGVGWINQDYLKEQYYWRAVMVPAVLTANQERALKPGNEFSECTSFCPTMVMVPAGNFMMGSPEGLGDYKERPQHEVTISKPFAVGGYEVTFAQWDACVVAGGCPKAPDSGWGRGQRPVVNVSWDDARQYAVWLARLTGKDYRLLSEAEWEYAARAGAPTAYTWGDKVVSGNANRLDDGTTTGASLR